MSSTKKTFDAVEMMRTIRDSFSAEIEGMTLEEEREWLASRDVKDPFLRRLLEKARQSDATSDASRRN